MDYGNHFAPSPAVDAEIRNVGGDYGALGMKFAQPDQA
jgi:hypothetical protein